MFLVPASHVTDCRQRLAAATRQVRECELAIDVAHQRARDCAFLRERETSAPARDFRRAYNDLLSRGFGNLLAVSSFVRVAWLNGLIFDGMPDTRRPENVLVADGERIRWQPVVDKQSWIQQPRVASFRLDYKMPEDAASYVHVTVSLPSDGGEYPHFLAHHTATRTVELIRVSDFHKDANLDIRWYLAGPPNLRSIRLLDPAYPYALPLWLCTGPSDDPDPHVWRPSDGSLKPVRDAVTGAATPPDPPLWFVFSDTANPRA